MTQYFGEESYFNEDVTFYKNVTIHGNLTTNLTSPVTDLTLTNLTVTGQSNLGVTTSTNFTSQNINISGIATIGTVTISSGIVTATTFSGNLSGNVTGNVSGNVTGNVSGDINSSGVSTFSGVIRVSSIQDLSGNTLFSSNFDIGRTSGNAASSADAIIQANRGARDGLYWITLGGTPRQVFCMFDGNRNGWMLSMRFQYDSSTLGWSSAYWTDTNVLNSSSLATDEVNIKTYAFNSWNIQGFRMCASSSGTDYTNNALDFPSGGTRVGFYNKTLRTIFNEGNNIYNEEVNLGRAAWMSWVVRSTTAATSAWDNQPNCNEDRINANFTYAGARIGISMNNEGDCNTNDSCIGFGLFRNGMTELASGGMSWNPDVRYPSYGWLWVR